MDLLWKFVPELPDTTRELIIAIKGHKTPVQGFMSARKKWCVSRNVNNNNELEDQSSVYAWRELPEMPPVPIEKTVVQPDVVEDVKTKTIETVTSGPKSIGNKK